MRDTQELEMPVYGPFATEDEAMVAYAYLLEDAQIFLLDDLLAAAVESEARNPFLDFPLTWLECAQDDDDVQSESQSVAGAEDAHAEQSSPGGDDDEHVALAVAASHNKVQRRRSLGMDPHEASELALRAVATAAPEYELEDADTDEAIVGAAVAASHVAVERRRSSILLEAANAVAMQAAREDLDDLDTTQR